MAYLTIVYKVVDLLEEETLRGAVRKPDQYLKHIYWSEKYKVKRFISFKPLLVQLFIQLVFAYFT